MPFDEKSHGWRHVRAGADEIPGLVQMGPGSGAPDADPWTPLEGDLLVGDGDTGYFVLYNLDPADSSVLRNVLGADFGDTVPTWKATLDATNPADVTPEAAAAPGTSLIYSHRDHVHALKTSETDTDLRLAPDGVGGVEWGSGGGGGGPIYIPFGTDRLGQSFTP